jgi:hypothetical protein
VCQFQFIGPWNPRSSIVEVTQRVLAHIMALPNLRKIAPAGRTASNGIANGKDHGIEVVD